MIYWSLVLIIVTIAAHVTNGRKHEKLILFSIISVCFMIAYLINKG